MGWLEAATAVAVALIGGPLILLLKRIDRRNTTQHAAAQAERISSRNEMRDHMNRIEEKVDGVTGLVADHLAFHAHNKEGSE